MFAGVAATLLIVAVSSPSWIRSLIDEASSSGVGNLPVVTKVAQNVQAAVGHSSWQTRKLRDKLTDATRLQATTTSATDQTQYSLSFQCDADGERLEVATFRLDSSPKRIPYTQDAKLFNFRIDSGPVHIGTLRIGDYNNAGTIDFSAFQFPIDITRAQSLVFANIFETEQISVVTDFPSSFREECRKLTKSLREEKAKLYNPRLTSATLEQFSDVLTFIDKKYGNKGPYAGLSNKTLPMGDANGSISNPFGGIVDVNASSVNGNENTGWSIRISDIPTEVCIRLLTDDNYETVARKIAVNNTIIVDDTKNTKVHSKPTAQAVAATCGASEFDTIEWIFAPSSYRPG